MAPIPHATDYFVEEFRGWKFSPLSAMLLWVSAFGAFAAGVLFENLNVGLVALLVWMSAMLMSRMMPGAGFLIMLEGDVAFLFALMKAVWLAAQ